MKPVVLLFSAAVLAALGAMNYMLASSPPKVTALVSRSGNEVIAMADAQDLSVSPRTYKVTATLERPLFVPSRRPYVPPPPPPEPAPAKPAPVKAPPPPPPPPPAPPPNLMVYGIQMFPEGRRALVAEQGSGQPDWIAEGEAINGWAVAAIHADGVELRDGERSQVFDLYPEQGR